MATTAPKYYLDKDNSFVIENYNYAKPFANFFPGIAGKYGVPIWVFYANRGQAIASFGTKDKDHAILEFFPANKTWQFVSNHGFRTFYKVSGKKQTYYEPFHNGYASERFSLHNLMRITSSDLILEETNETLGLHTRVHYYTIPNDSYGALVREVTVTNTSRSAKEIEIIDGLPQIVPFGTNNWFLKHLSRTIEGWMNVENLEHGVPYFKLAVDPSDRPEVVHIHEGNFYLGVHEERGVKKLLKPLVDPATVFGQITDFSQPHAFLSAKRFTAPAHETTTSKTPCAMLHLRATLAAGKSKSFSAVAGYLRSKDLLGSLTKKCLTPGYLEAKKAENRTLIASLEANVETASASKEFDLYCKQTYLDNLLRGGFPLTFSSGEVFYLYSRKHGDLERDYNNFQIQPSYFSQGNGNYRDVNQNRRLDTWFNPKVGDSNIVAFMNLLQSDGYNPLVVKGSTFTLQDCRGMQDALRASLPAEDQAKVQKLCDFLAKPFTPGDLAIYLEQHGLAADSKSMDEIVETAIRFSRKMQDAEHGEGFWSDHWTYNLDLIENYLSLYPEQKRSLLFEKRIFTFFDNAEYVKPRSEKHQLHDGKVKQLHSVGVDTAKKELLKKRLQLPHTARTGYGTTDEVYSTSLFNKLLCLAANKFASLDPMGMGIEMEADKPNWYDALNGLPALFGSSLNETLELRRLMQFMQDALTLHRSDTLPVTEEVAALMQELVAAIKDTYADENDIRFAFWDATHTVKELYWQKTRLGFSGTETGTPVPQIKEFLTLACRKLDDGIAAAKDKESGLYYGYFIHEPVTFELTKAPLVKVTSFKQVKLPFFLEAQVHAMKTLATREAKALHLSTKKSPLFDKKLGMYKVTSPLAPMPLEIGRCRVFAPGWLENESIWLHMEYKYLLELLKKGMYEEFYAEIPQTLIPFMKPSVYGRSVLENSSFIASSAFPDKSQHGTGFVARLSGSTAEFLQMLLTMNYGPAPFFLNAQEQLNLRFAPALAKWLFAPRTKTYQCTFLGSVKITYLNPSLKDTFGAKGAKVTRISFTCAQGKAVTIQGDTIPAPYAAQVREKRIKEISIELK